MTNKLYIVCSQNKHTFIAQEGKGDWLGQTRNSKFVRFFTDIEEARSYKEGRRNWRVIEVEVTW